MLKGKSDGLHARRHQPFIIGDELFSISLWSEVTFGDEPGLPAARLSV